MEQCKKNGLAHLCLQLCGVVALTQLAFHTAQYPALSSVFQREPVFIMGAKASAVEWITLIFMLSIFLHWKTLRTDRLPFLYPSWKQWLPFLALYLLSAMLLIMATYPPPEMTRLLTIVQQSSSLLGGPIAVDIVKSFSMPVLVSAFLLCVPFSTLRRYPMLALLMLATVTIVMWVDVFEALYHVIVTPALIRIVFQLLTLLFAEVSANPLTGTVVANGFQVFIGPSCSGIESVLLFTLFFAHCVLAIVSDRVVFRKHRLLYSYILGVVILFFLNALRITSLIAVGTVFPVFALTLFHSILGSIYFFIFFAFYLPKIKEWA